MKNALRLITPLAGLLLALALAPPDGDPLDVYDFSGTTPHASFLQRGDSVVHRHGLWTVQHFTHEDPFGGEWFLSGRERINVFYGSRPMWHSEWKRDISIDFMDGPLVTSDDVWTSLRGERGESVVDVTGGDEPTLRLHMYEGGSSDSSSSDQTIQLRGHSPETAAVAVIWDSIFRYEHRDIDDDGTFEVVMPFITWVNSGQRPRSHARSGSIDVALSWDDELNRYRFAPELSASLWSDEIGPDKIVLREAVARAVDEDERTGDSGDEWFEVRSLLTDSLLRRIVSGQDDLVADLIRRTRFEPYADPPDAWWKKLHTEITGHFLWDDICDAHPSLRELKPTL